jgi:MSHA biogenesis protein MshI
VIGSLFGKGRKRSDSSIALQLANESLHIVARLSGGDLRRESLPWTEADSDAEAFEKFVEANGLQGASTRLLLALDGYQMLLVDAPPVETQELAGALKWKVKDLLSQPIENSVVEGFLLPEDAFRGSRKMAYAVAAAKPPIESLTDMFQKQGLILDSVGIAEMVALTMSEGDDDHPAIAIVIGSDSGFMAVVADKALYLVRKFELNYQDLVSEGETREQAIERLVLDIQRSRDYFESQMGKGAVNRLLMLPLGGENTPLQQTLSDRMGLPIEMLASEMPELTCAEQYLIESLVSHEVQH